MLVPIGGNITLVCVTLLCDSAAGGGCEQQGALLVGAQTAQCWQHCMGCQLALEPHDVHTSVIGKCCIQLCRLCADAVWPWVAAQVCSRALKHLALQVVCATKIEGLGWHSWPCAAPVPTRADELEAWSLIPWCLAAVVGATTVLHCTSIQTVTSPCCMLRPNLQDRAGKLRCSTFCTQQVTARPQSKTNAYVSRIASMKCASDLTGSLEMRPAN
jgi:hypothetical protein